MQGRRKKLDEVLQQIKRFNRFNSPQRNQKERKIDEWMDFINFYSEAGKDRRATVRVNHIQKSLSRNIKNMEQINDSLIRIEMNVKGHDLVIVAVFAPSG